MKKVGIVGSGIAGVSAAYYLEKFGFEVTIFEAGKYFGGHTNTIDINVDNKSFPIDTGFLVHNNRTYPNLIDFFKELEVKTFPSEMTFSVLHQGEDIEWAGDNIGTLFAQKKNYFSPRFWHFLYEILKFNKNAKRYLEEARGKENWSLGDLISHYGYSEKFCQWYLYPMGGCIWSTPVKDMEDYPAFTFIEFCLNHGLLQVFDRPQWKTVLSGGREYVKLALSNIDKKFLESPVESVQLEGDKTTIISNGEEFNFDYCLFCTHPPQTLSILKTANHSIKEVLESFKYQPNQAVVHTDPSILPSNKKTWSAWNFQAGENDLGEKAVCVSYLINKLQPLPVETPVLVTLNPVTTIDPKTIIKKINYEHPLFNNKTQEAQKNIPNIQGIDNCFFAGAWCRYGFHEDGILSGKLAVNAILEASKYEGAKLEILE